MAAGLLVEKELNNQAEEFTKDHFAWFCEDLKSLTSFFENNLSLQEGLVEDIFHRTI